MKHPGPARLRAERARLVADRRLGGRAFGAALADILDDALTQLLERVEIPSRWCLVAMGSYGRRASSPGSDIDLMLCVDARRTGDLEAAARSVWYPLWDAGFVLGHSVRTIRQALALASRDLEALTSLVDARWVAGDPEVTDELSVRVRRLAVKRGEAMIVDLSEAARERRTTPGPIAEMLEPDLKQGSGGLRDVQSLAWAGTALDESGPGGVDQLVARGYLDADDRSRLDAGGDVLLDVRLALHRVSGGRTDLLTLQDQDEVAALLDEADADALVRTLATAAREVAWISADTWERLRSTLTGPARRGGRPRPLAEGVVSRDGRVAFVDDESVEVVTVLRAAAVAAERGLPFERAALRRCAQVEGFRWGPHERDAFLALLGEGARAIPVFEALDHVGVLARVLPEWDGVRSRPQRNAYHRFTVDRHLLEAVAECATLRRAQGFDGEVARRCRADVLLLAALLHDIGKGADVDHSIAGGEIARAVGARIGLDPVGTDTLEWLVRHHLLLVDTATRRDLADETTVLRFGRAVGTSERLDLLYVLSIGDSKATGPAAWSRSRAALFRELYVRADALLEAGTVDAGLEARQRVDLARRIGDRAAARMLEDLPRDYSRSFGTEAMVRHHELIQEGMPRVDWREDDDALLELTVVAPDRSGLLAGVASALAVAGIDVRDAQVFSTENGVALQVFRGEDRFGRMTDPAERARATAMIEEVARDETDVTAQLRARRDRYRRAPGVVRTRIDLDASTSATVIEVHAPDEVGLLATVAAVFADLGLDVVHARAQTLGERVIDVFYLRDQGRKITDRLSLDRLRATVVARLTTEYVLD